MMIYIKEKLVFELKKKMNEDPNLLNPLVERKRKWNGKLFELLNLFKAYKLKEYNSNLAGNVLVFSEKTLDRAVRNGVESKGSEDLFHLLGYYAFRDEWEEKKNEFYFPVDEKIKSESSITEVEKKSVSKDVFFSYEKRLVILVFLFAITCFSYQLDWEDENINDGFCDCLIGEYYPNYEERQLARLRNREDETSGFDQGKEIGRTNEIGSTLPATYTEPVHYIKYLREIYCGLDKLYCQGVGMNEKTIHEARVKNMQEYKRNIDRYFSRIDEDMNLGRVGLSSK